MVKLWWVTCACVLSYIRILERTFKACVFDINKVEQTAQCSILSPFFGSSSPAFGRCSYKPAQTHQRPSDCHHLFQIKPLLEGAI